MAKKQETLLREGQIQFDYLKSCAFRVVHVDGVHGGIRPDGQSIQMALFSERSPIPQQEIFEVSSGQLGEMKERKDRGAIVREVEVEAIMDLDTARTLRDWLTEKLELMEKFIASSKAESKEEA